LNIIEVNNLSKQFGIFTAVNRVSFTVETGEIFGFLGPNGAGKTTTINMLTGLARPTSGDLFISGYDGKKEMKKVQGSIGVVPDESNLYDDMSGFENLTFCASLYGIPKAVREKRAKELLEQFDLADTGKRKFKAYSKGMKRKLTIAAGVIHEPSILFLDEPTTGIDVESARHIRSWIRDLNNKGTTIFLTTHYIEDAERLCDRIGFIVNGKVIQVSSKDDLMKNTKNEHIMEFFLDQPAELFRNDLLDRFPLIRVKRTQGEKIRIGSDQIIHLVPFINFFQDRNVNVLEAKIIRPSLEEVFVSITGIEIDKLKKEKEGKKK
jgi:ABC-2 type transport system ATP-binding protein